MNTLKNLELELQRGRLSRRDFIARASALGLGAVAVASLLAKSAAAATPKRGGRLRIG